MGFDQAGYVVFGVGSNQRHAQQAGMLPGQDIDLPE
jgi:hypothetical protein